MLQYAALQEMTLFISAGHSDRDPGAWPTARPRPPSSSSSATC